MNKTLPLILLVVAGFLFFLNLTKIANQVPPVAPTGVAFSLKAQRVVACTPAEITLVDSHGTSTHLEKDGELNTPSSWPECSIFQNGDVLDFYLSRGAKTRFLSDEKTVWWRKTL